MGGEEISLKPGPLLVALDAQNDDSVLISIQIF